MARSNFIQRIKSWIFPTPGPQQIAKQLRHPQGKLGEVVGRKMNESNESLYDLTIDCMALKDHDSLIELGYGNGRFFEKIFSKAKNLRVVGIDFSEVMVRTARETNETRIDNGELRLLYGNCTALPFDSNQFDKVFCINVIYFWENPVEYLHEIYRVLKPGGRFYSTIRLRDSMKNLPFTQFGFTLYDEADWKSILNNNKFNYISGKLLHEPGTDVMGNKMELESICMMAEKPL